mmetsp:Transcript_75372/g.214350  ORF Transcript_75372/g.214350 Transcript_75372/m.214350 type:complete len:99 (+) Transcript_75372:1982-2278(+)
MRWASGLPTFKSVQEFGGERSVLQQGHDWERLNHSCRHEAQNTCTHLVYTGYSTSCMQMEHVNSEVCASWPGRTLSKVNPIVEPSSLGRWRELGYSAI